MSEVKFFRVVGRHRGFVKDDKSDPDEYPQSKGITGGVTIAARTSKNRPVIKAVSLTPNPSLISLWPFDVKLDDGRLKIFADSEDPAYDQPDVLLVANCSALNLDEDEELIYTFSFSNVTANGQRQDLPTFSFVAPHIPDSHDDGPDGIISVDWTTVPWLENAGSIPGGQIIEMVPDNVTQVGPNLIQFWANGSALGEPLEVDVEVSSSVAWSSVIGRPAIFDEDDMASDSATGVPTQQSVKAFVIARTSGVGTGDMTAAVYDPAGVHGSAFSQDNMADGATNKNYSTTDKNKLAGIAAGATVNDTDANLKNRTNHTGTQLASTISNLNTAVDARIASAAGASVAPLVGGFVPTSFIPSVALTTVQTAASAAVMLSLTTQEGDFVIRTDEHKTYVRNANATGTVADFTVLDTPLDAVTSVNSQVGTVVLGKSDVGLANVDNTTDANKPISTATQTALNLKAPLASPAFTGTVTGITKTMVGLGNVDNTADTAKPVSTAQQTALNGKANSSHTHAVTDLTATGTPDSTKWLRGDGVWATAPSGGAPAAASASVAANETYSTTAYGDLATTTDTVTVAVGASGIALVSVNGYMHGGAAGRTAYISFALSGANTLAASDLNSTYLVTPSSGGGQSSGVFVLTGLNPGNTTFKMKYKSSAAGACDFQNRSIGVLSW